MKCISLWQPYAQLCVVNAAVSGHRSSVGAKRFETRHWSTRYRGPLLIHAAKKCTPDLRAVAGCGLVEQLLKEGFRRDYTGWNDLPFGAIVGRVQLIGCFRMRDIPKPSQTEQAVGDWTPDRYAWEFARPELFAHPVPFVGRQAFFDVPDGIVPA